MKLKAILLLFVVQCFALGGNAQVRCDSLLGSGSTVKKAHFMAMDRYGKLNFLLYQFDLAGREARGMKYDNLELSPTFRMVGQLPEGVSYKTFAAAKKAMKQYELDSRENTQGLVAKVLFEKEATGENIWAILISKRQLSHSGNERLEPIVIYSIERNTTGEKLVRISHGFDGPVL